MDSLIDEQFSLFVNTLSTCTQLVINKRYGGFSLSQAGIALYIGLRLQKEPTWTPYFFRTNGESIFNQPEWDTSSLDCLMTRKDEFLVQVVQMLGEKANGTFAKLQIIVIPQVLLKYAHIHEYDGYETLDVDYNLYKMDQIVKISDDVSLKAIVRCALIKKIAKFDIHTEIIRKFGWGDVQL